MRLYVVLGGFYVYPVHEYLHFLPVFLNFLLGGVIRIITPPKPWKFGVCGLAIDYNDQPSN